MMPLSKDKNKKEGTIMRKTERNLLRKLALQRCELELLRSHPKDERGSVREIGLWLRMFANLHFSSYPPSLRSG